ncbi:MAG: ATP-binding protein [Anaerolineae bacterium]
MRQPLEDRIVTIGRANGSLTLPANSRLITAMDSCPRGYSPCDDVAWLRRADRAYNPR